MKKLVDTLITLITVILVVGVFINSYAGDEGPRTLKVKGLYIGMDIDEAKTILERTFTGVKCQKMLLDGSVYYNCSSDGCMVTATSDEKVSLIMFGSTDKIFNTHGLSTEEFIEKFI